MNELLPSLLQWFVGVAGGGLLLGYIARLAISHFFSRDLERFRAHLQAQSAVELERLRTEMQKALFEHSTRFGWLHSRKGEALAEIHREAILASAATRQAAMAADIVSELGPRAYPMLQDPLRESVGQMKKAVATYRAFRPFLDSGLDHLVGRFLLTLQKAQSSVEYAGIFLNPKLTAQPPAREEAAGYLKYWAKQLDPTEEDFVRHFRSALEEARQESAECSTELDGSKKRTVGTG